MSIPNDAGHGSTRPEPDISARTVVCLADVEPEETVWLWESRIPMGHLTLFLGDGGVGKSHICLSIASSLSAGTALPGERATEVPAATVYFTGEDYLPEMRRRMDAMDGHPENVYAYGEPFALDEDGFSFIENEAVTKKARLVIIDPIVAFLGSDIDFYRANQTRSVLAPLASIAHRTKAAILLVTHVTKGGNTKAAHRALGSADFSNAARSALLAGTDPNNDDRRGLFHCKANLGPISPAIGYTINDGHFAWTGETTLTAEEVLGTEGEEGGAVGEAEDFLRVVLAEGAQPPAKVQEEAKQAGIRERTLRRARQRICRTDKSGFKGGWIWELRPDARIDSEGGQTVHDGQVGHLGEDHCPAADTGGMLKQSVKTGGAPR